MNDMNADERDIVIHPVRTKKDIKIPRFGILFVNPVEAAAAITEVLESGGTRHFLHNSNLAVTADAGCFVAGPAIGAPMAVLVLEKLIVLGAEEIILMGWCGAIDRRYRIGDIIIPDGAVSGEGTSRYYCLSNQYLPAEKSIALLRSVVTEQKMTWKGGNIWSTDAPYRESRSLLTALQATRRVVAVDMEFSALCNVAGFRGVDFAAILIVSDEILEDNWKPGFKSNILKMTSKTLLRLLIAAHTYQIAKRL